MAVIENDAAAAWQPLADPGQSRVNENRNFRVDRNLVKRVPNRVTRWETVRSLSDDAKSDETRVSSDRAFIFLYRILAQPRIQRQPMSEHCVLVFAVNVKRVVMQGTNLVHFHWVEYRRRQIHNHSHIVFTECGDHFIVGLKCRPCTPDALLVL